MRLATPPALPSLAFTFTALATLATLAVLPGCGDSGETGGDASAEAGDGKLHPPGNGQMESESAACTALSQAQDSLNAAMACTATTRPCPSLIQVQVGGTACLQYDQGSVQGCVDNYNAQTTCDALAAAVDNCVVTSFAGSAPNGCP